MYDLRSEPHGQFDLMFNYGLLYHLRHPFLSLDTTRRVCRGAMVLETHIVNSLSTTPIAAFYHDDVFTAWTNWTGPTEAAVASWLRSAGFLRGQDATAGPDPPERSPGVRRLLVASGPTAS